MILKVTIARDIQIINAADKLVVGDIVGGIDSHRSYGFSIVVRKLRVIVRVGDVGAVSAPAAVCSETDRLLPVVGGTGRRLKYILGAVVVVLP